MYYYLLMFQNDFLKNNVIEELLRERTNYYLSQKKKRDFWIVLAPSFLNSIEEKNLLNTVYFQKEKKEQKKKYSAAFISTNKELINWIALRLGEFEAIDSFSSKDYDILSSFDKKNKNSNGIRGQKEFSISSLPFLKSNSEELDPLLYAERYQKAKQLLS